MKLALVNQDIHHILNNAIENFSLQMESRKGLYSGISRLNRRL